MKRRRSLLAAFDAVNRTRGQCDGTTCFHIFARSSQCVSLSDFSCTLLHTMNEIGLTLIPTSARNKRRAFAQKQALAVGSSKNSAIAEGVVLKGACGRAEGGVGKQCGGVVAAPLQ